MTHICVSKSTIIGSDIGLSPGRRQVITQTNTGILLIGTSGANFSETLNEPHALSFKKMHLKMSSAKKSTGPSVTTMLTWLSHSFYFILLLLLLLLLSLLKGMPFHSDNAPCEWMLRCTRHVHTVALPVICVLCGGQFHWSCPCGLH